MVKVKKAMLCDRLKATGQREPWFKQLKKNFVEKVNCFESSRNIVIWGTPSAGR
jgi:hypothetical protein